MQATAPSGYTLTSGAQSSTNPTAPITVIAGQTYDKADFGYRNASLNGITDRVWYDADRDGLQDPGEAGIAGVTVNLYADLDGDGSFTKNVIGGKVDVNGDGVIDTSDDCTSCFLGYGIVDGVIYSGGAPLASGALNGVTVISGLLDMNGDGGDPPSRQRHDRGRTASSPPTSRDDAGNFVFTGLANGKYVMEIADNAGQLISYQGTTADAQAYQRAVTVAGADVTGVHFGYAGLGPIGNTVFSDANGNGVQDPGESGIAGVTVKLYRDANGNSVFDPVTDNLVATTTTNGSGNYAFNDLVAGTYFVSIDKGQPALSGYTSTTTTDQELANETGASGSTTEIDVTLTAGVTTIRVIGGSLDMNGDGVITPADNGFANGVTSHRRQLDLNGDGSINASDAGWWNGIRVIGGQLDVNADGAINTGATAPTTAMWRSASRASSMPTSAIGMPVWPTSPAWYSTTSTRTGCTTAPASRSSPA